MPARVMPGQTIFSFAFGPLKSPTPFSSPSVTCSAALVRGC